MGLFSGKKNDIIYNYNLPFRLCMPKVDFILYKTEELYKKILIACFNHSTGFSEKEKAAVWDNYNVISTYDAAGAISLMANAMANRSIAYIIYDERTGVTRRAVGDEINQLIEDYKTRSVSNKGIIANFERLKQADLIKAYLDLLYSTLDALNTQTQLSKAVRIKMSKLRETLSNFSNENVVEQAKAISDALSNGQGALLDKDDEIDTTKIDSTPAKAQFEFVANLIAGELGVSLSFVTGALTGGIGTTGESEVETNEQGIKYFWSSIFKPSFDQLMNTSLKFKTENYRKTAELVKILPLVESSELIEPQAQKDFADMVLSND